MQVWSHANWNFHYPQTADRRRLTALARDRNAAQKHVWRAEIVLLSATVSAVSFERSQIFRWDPAMH